MEPDLIDELRRGAGLHKYFGEIRIAAAMDIFAKWLELNNEGHDLKQLYDFLSSTNDNPNIVALPD